MQTYTLQYLLNLILKLFPLIQNMKMDQNIHLSIHHIYFHLRK